MQFKNNILYSPFYIFIKFGYPISDEDVLDKLGIRDYQELSLKETKEEYIREINKFYITELGDWTHIIDGWYGLWYSDIRTYIDEIAKNHEVFYASIGDIDDSFDFVYYQNSILRRKYVVEDPHFSRNKLVIKENYGSSLVGEEKILLQRDKDPWYTITELAQNIGISLNHPLENIRAYGVPDKDDFVFNENEY